MPLLRGRATAVRLAPARWGAVAFVLCSAASAATVESVYAERCAQCHASGAGGAPMPGDRADWAQRLSAGKSLVYRSALEGMPNTAMAPKGGHRDLSDAMVQALVDYMLAQTQLSAEALKAAARYEALGIRSRSFIRLDLNRDGLLARDEVRDDAELLSRFAQFDRDGDGRLNESEYAHAETTLAAERASVQVDDETLRERVRETLRAVSGVSVTGIRIEVVAGAVSVAGVVQTGEMATRAGDAMRRIPGVRSLDNRLMSGEMLHFD